MNKQILQNQRILISGGGIAGLTLAYWLKRFGFTPVVVESAPHNRLDGYMIDFLGPGYTVAERMQILQALETEQSRYKIDELLFVNAKNKKTGSLKTSRMRELLSQRYFNLLRSGLERCIYDQVKNECDIRFETTIKDIKDGKDGIEVTFSRGQAETFDLLAGADGLRSNTRRLVFGPDEQFERFMGYYTSAFTVDNFIGQDRLFLSYTEPGRQAGIYDAGAGHLATFFIYRSPEILPHMHQNEKKQQLKEAFRGLNWYIPEILRRMELTEDFYFDAVSQIELEQWHRGRTVLLGDAAQAVSLISGQGASLAMAGAYILAGELKKAGGDYSQAFAAYQQIMQPEIRRKQKMARDFAGSFVPESGFGLFLRNLFTNLMSVPLVSDYLVNRYFNDKLNLQDYENL